MSMQAESSLSRQPVENGLEDRTTLTQADNSTSAGQESSFVSQAEEVGVIIPLSMVVTFITYPILI